MKRFLTTCLIAGLLPGWAAAAQATFTEFVRIDGHRFPIFFELFLEPAGRTRIAAKVAGNLRAIQVNMPGLLSDVVDDVCERKITLQVENALAEDDHIRLNGRVQIVSYACNADGDFDSRRQRFSNTTAVDVLLYGGIENNCLRAHLQELSIAPGGLAGVVMSLFNLTERVSETVRAELNDEINTRDMCFDLPDPLVALNANLSSGGFRDFGGGELGFVVEGHADLTAAGVIDLIELLPPPKSCDCD